MSIIETIKKFLENRIRKTKLLPESQKQDEYEKIEQKVENEEKGKNNLYENTLIKLLKNTDKYIVNEQYNRISGNLEFYHVQSKNYIAYENKDDAEYISIDTYRKNLSELVYEIVKQMKDTPFYFKFSSDQLLERENIKEKLVIFTDKENIDDMNNILKKVKEEHNDLFIPSEEDKNNIDKEAIKEENEDVR